MAFATDEEAADEVAMDEVGRKRLCPAFLGATCHSADDDVMALHAVAQAAMAGDWSGPHAICLHRRRTHFEKKVWEALLRIPHGALASFGDVTMAIGARDEAII